MYIATFLYYYHGALYNQYKILLSRKGLLRVLGANSKLTFLPFTFLCFVILFYAQLFLFLAYPVARFFSQFQHF